MSIQQRKPFMVAKLTTTKVKSNLYNSTINGASCFMNEKELMKTIKSFLNLKYKNKHATLIISKT